jgi:hypothetical protein
MLSADTVAEATVAFQLDRPPRGRDLSIGSNWDGPTEEDDAEFGKVHYQ